VGVHDSRYRSGGGLGRGDDSRVDAVGQALHDILGHLVADVADEQGHRDARDRVAEPEARRHRDQSDQGTCR
jgi:hypothetical protein